MKSDFLCASPLVYIYIIFYIYIYIVFHRELERNNYGSRCLCKERGLNHESFVQVPSSKRGLSSFTIRNESENPPAPKLPRRALCACMTGNYCDTY